MTDSADDFTRRIGARILGLRKSLGLSIEGLAAASGVSRSMISLVERGEASPTAAVLEKLSVGLGVTLAALFEPDVHARAVHAPLARRSAQPEWRDPDSGYVRRNVAPTGVGPGIQLVDVLFPAGARVTFDTALVAGHPSQYVWVLDGAMVITVGDVTHELHGGDCLWMSLEAPRVFHNPFPHDARYAVILHTDNPARG